jgi:uncharacterized protein (TIGR03437 family)
MKPILSAWALLMVVALPVWCANTITTVLGQPTDRSITVNIRGDAPLELYFEYGTKPGSYTSRTKSVTTTTDPYASGFYLSQSVMDGLVPDTSYCYRMQSRPAGSSAAFAPGAESCFHTQRPPGSSFVFAIQGDSHPEREKTMFSRDLYLQTLAAVAKEQPDFYLTSGDDFSVDTLPTPYTSAAVTGRYTLQLPYFDVLTRSTPLFLVTGNHEETSLSNFNLPPDSANSNQVPIWAQNAHNLYYPSPAPNDPVTGAFYTGNTTNIPGIGLLRDYYAWQWGDALFVVIDPYWSSPAQVDTGLGGQNNTGGGKTPDRWQITHGDAQYFWLKQTLEQSKAKWKFIFAHHVMGTGRGGIEIANQFEWGGQNANGTQGFAANRPTWTAPIHQLMVANKVTVFFQAHDHVFAHQELDGVVYQELPNPADNTYTAFNADAYKTGDVFPNAGYVKVNVNPASVKVEYIRQFLPQDQKAPDAVNGMVQFAYTIPATAVDATPAISSVATASGGAAIAPNTWIEIKGSNLSAAANSRVWTSSDFVNNQMPLALDGVSATVGGKPAFVYYISPSQVNVLTPPDLSPGPAEVRVTVNGRISSPVTAQVQSVSPAFFLLNGGPRVVATHADNSLIGPTDLAPGAKPAQPGETIVLYGNGFGTTSAPVISGATTQSGTISPLPLVRIGDLTATVQFAGLIAPGLFQINATIPANAPDGELSIVATGNSVSTPSGALLAVQH